MAQASHFASGGQPIETWTVTCSRCGKPVSVTGAAGVAVCAGCGTSVRAEALATVAGVARAPTPSDPHDSLVGTRLGSWQLDRLLGRGGMGRVYEARDLGSGRRVALKVLSEALAQDPAFVRRFRREGKVLASLSHPHLVEVLDQGEDHGQVWFAMEYVRGETLRRRLERGALTPTEAVRTASEICSALAYAHDKGVVHRDLKPENVLLGEDGRVRLADFGLLRLVRESTPESTTRLTRTDVILGTYEYMAPEQRREAGEVDGRSDLFSLGVMLYEGLTGKLPLGRFTPASELVPGLSPGMDTVIHRALAPEPKDRYSSARELSSALAQAMTQHPRTPGAAARDERASHEASALPKDRDAAARHQAPTLGDAGTERADARFLHHADLLATLDRVFAVLLMLAFAVPGLGTLLYGRGLALMPWLGVGLFVFIYAIWLLRVGRRLRHLEPSARDAQILASVLMLLMFPLGTALGIYGLIVMAPLRARLAFERVRRGAAPAWGGRTHAVSAPPPPPAPPLFAADGRPLRRVEVLVPEARRGAGILPRLLLASAILWTLFLAFAGTGAVRIQADSVPVRVGVERDPARDRRAQHESDWSRQIEQGRIRSRLESWQHISALGAGFALLLSLFAWRRRHRQRGFGLAFASVLILGVDLVMLGLRTTSLAFGSLSFGAWLGP